MIEVAPEAPEQTFLFLHGFGGNATQWRYQIEAFAERNRVLAPDMRGHGRSSRPRSDYEMERLLADLEHIVAARGVRQKMVVVGHSFGGAVGVDFALRHPQRVARLVLIATAAEYRIFWFYRLAFRLPTPILRAVLQPLISGFVDAGVIPLKRMFQETVSQWQGWSKLASLQFPVMVIRGERDRVFPQASFARVAEVIPNAEDVNVGASAHMVMIERRDAVNRAIERFIDSAPAASRHTRWRSGEEDWEPHSRLVPERPWLLHYESGVPHTIDIPRVPLTRLLDRTVRKFRYRPAIYYDGRRLSYRYFNNQANRFANALRSLGIGQGARVMLLLPNVPQFPVAYYGALRLGAIAVMSNPLAGDEEIVRQARDSGAEVLVTLTTFQETAMAVHAQTDVRHVIFAHVDDYAPLYRPLQMLFFPWRRRWLRNRLRHSLTEHDHRWRALLRSQSIAPPEVTVAASDVAVIQYTGGTTDEPHGITLTHANLVANTLQARVWIPTLSDGEERVLSVVPFNHAYGMTTAMNLPVAIGAEMILLPEFDTRAVLEHIRRHRPALFPGVPAMYVAINNFPGVRRFGIDTIQACISGAAPLPIEVEEAFERLTKGRLIEGYGLSEASPLTHANPIFGQDKVGSIGLPVPNTEARIVDLRTGIPLLVPVGEFGELQVRGPQVMAGYWQNEPVTRAVLDADGWLRTSDIARMDADGYFQIISRRQDTWQSEDASLAFPRDVEEVIYELPEVREVVVIAIANLPVAFVQLKEGTNVPADSIIAFARRRLPAQQVPRRIVFVKEFPRSLIGKVLRRELVSQYEHAIEAGSGTVGAHLPGLQDRNQEER
ncbi:MAG: alpha/beta fold hydrolase [Anaerolineae bacterium]|nr:alpha/beta fold hydrolase [Anaerolineae bacterium]